MKTKTALILCNRCGELHAADESFVNFFEAKYGPQGLTDLDIAVLMCPMIHELKPGAVIRELMQFKCEDCGRTIYVAKSSAWFLERKGIKWTKTG